VHRLGDVHHIVQKEKSRPSQKRDILPESFDSIADAAAFWESHDSADYEDLMEEAEFEIDIKRHIYLVPIAGFVLDKLREQARSQGVSTETFVNVLLQEHV
jgi:hypothetical protein